MWLLEAGFSIRDDFAFSHPFCQRGLLYYFSFKEKVTWLVQYSALEQPQKLSSFKKLTIWLHETVFFNLESVYICLVDVLVDRIILGNEISTDVIFSSGLFTDHSIQTFQIW